MGSKRRYAQDGVTFTIDISSREDENYLYVDIEEVNGREIDKTKPHLATASLVVMTPDSPVPSFFG
jgi:hypothetical protein